MFTKTASKLVQKEASLTAIKTKLWPALKGIFAKTPPGDHGQVLANVAQEAGKQAPSMAQRFKRTAITGGIGAAVGAGLTYNNHSNQLNQVQPPQHFQSLPQPNFYR